MTSTELRARQQPLKTKYKEDPAAGIVTFHSRSVLAENVTAKVDSKFGTIIAGLHPATGGTGAELCSGDMLLEALTACAAVTMNAVASSMEISYRHAEVRAKADLDFKGTLGVDRSAPVGFTAIELEFVIDTDAPQDKIDTLVKLTERYCVVFQTLSMLPKFTVTVSAA